MGTEPSTRPLSKPPSSLVPVPPVRLTTSPVLTMFTRKSRLLTRRPIKEQL